MPSGGDLVVRRITADDDTALAGRIVQQAYFALPGYPHDESYDLVIADVAGRAAEDGIDVVVATLDGVMVGCLTFVPGLGTWHAEFEDPEATSFRYFGVDPSAQGAGVGEAMVRWCLDETARLGQRRCRIHTLESMPGAQRLYERMGFVRTPELDGNWDGVIGLAFVFEL